MYGYQIARADDPIKQGQNQQTKNQGSSKQETAIHGMQCDVRFICFPEINRFIMDPCVFSLGISTKLSQELSTKFIR